MMMKWHDALTNAAMNMKRRTVCDAAEIKLTLPMGTVAHGENITHDTYGATLMTVRAKVRCNAKTDNEVHFCTVYEEPDERDTENMRFTKASPWGDIHLGIDNQAALSQFEINKEYYVDFSSA